MRRDYLLLGFDLLLSSLLSFLRYLFNDLSGTIGIPSTFFHRSFNAVTIRSLAFVVFSSNLLSLSFFAAIAKILLQLLYLFYFCE